MIRIIALSLLMLLLSATSAGCCGFLQGLFKGRTGVSLGVKTVDMDHSERVQS